MIRLLEPSFGGCIFSRVGEIQYVTLMPVLQIQISYLHVFSQVIYDKARSTFWMHAVAIVACFVVWVIFSQETDYRCLDLADPHWINNCKW